MDILNRYAWDEGSEEAKSGDCCGFWTMLVKFEVWLARQAPVVYTLPISIGFLNNCIYCIQSAVFVCTVNLCLLTICTFVIIEIKEENTNLRHLQSKKTT